MNEVPGVSSCDVLTDGVKADFKSLSSANNIISQASRAIKKQGSKLVLFEFTTNKNYEIIQNIKIISEKGIKGKYYFIDEKRIYSF